MTGGPIYVDKVIMLQSSRDDAIRLFRNNRNDGARWFQAEIEQINSKKARSTHQNHKQKQLSKGHKAFAAKGHKATLAKQEPQTSKAIDRKNETAVAVWAAGAGNTFYFNDTKEREKKELERQKAELRKRENKTAKVSEKLKEQLDTLK
ncbi:hypothetical protein ACHAWF_018441 [Thalassiosira exigua]